MLLPDLDLSLHRFIVPSTSTLSRSAAAIASHVLASPLWAASTRVGAYVAAPRLREVETGALLEAALREGAGSAASPSPKRLFVPVVDDRAAGMRLLHLGEWRGRGGEDEAGRGGALNHATSLISPSLPQTPCPASSPSRPSASGSRVQATRTGRPGRTV